MFQLADTTTSFADSISVSSIDKESIGIPQLEKNYTKFSDSKNFGKTMESKMKMTDVPSAAVAEKVSSLDTLNDQWNVFEKHSDDISTGESNRMERTQMVINRFDSKSLTDTSDETKQSTIKQEWTTTTTLPKIYESHIRVNLGQTDSNNNQIDDEEIERKEMEKFSKISIVPLQTPATSSTITTTSMVNIDSSMPGLIDHVPGKIIVNNYKES